MGDLGERPSLYELFAVMNVSVIFLSSFPARFADERLEITVEVNDVGCEEEILTRSVENFEPCTWES